MIIVFEMMHMSEPPGLCGLLLVLLPHMLIMYLTDPG